MTHFISEALVRALGWTLVHSLWQGALAALVLLLLLPRLQTARQRYWVAYSALSAVFVAAVVTFIVTFPAPGEVVYEPVDAVGETEEAGGFFTAGPVFETSAWALANTWLEENYPLIVAFWLLGFSFFLLRLAGGLWYVNRLSTRGVSGVGSEWEARTALLAQRLGMNRAVRLLESALVHTPVAIGWLKPVILLPIGLVNCLSPAEVEAVLAHELAHIARRDWLFNLLQAFIETLFYYHPAVWWMSHAIRRERENCCDDAALAATGNRLAFAKALVQVQEMAKPVPMLALGMSGSRRPLLLERVRRVLNQPQQKSHIMEKFTATAILLVLLALVGLRANNTPSLTAAFAQMSEFPAVLFGAGEEDDQIENDSIPKPKSTRKIIREDDKQRVEAEYRDGRLARLNIDGKEIPESEFDQHRDLTRELQREMRAPLAPLPLLPPLPPGADPAGIWIAPPAEPGYAQGWNIPNPPSPPTPPRISTTKDADGNTIIVLERDGDPTEIRVKDGEVWMNGEKLKEGEKLDLPGFENGFFYWNGDDGQSFQFSPGEFHFEGLEGLRDWDELSDEEKASLEADLAQMREDAEQMQLDQKEMMREQKRMNKEEQKRLKEEMKEYEKQWAEDRKNWEKEQKEWAKEQENWAKEQAQWAVEQQQWAKEQARNDAFAQSMKEELQRDGLVSDTRNFKLKLSEKEFKVNGTKQSDELHRKYLDLYRRKTGKELGPNGSFQWSESE